MPNYIVNKNSQPTGEHEVHQTTCNHLPDIKNQISLGSHINCQSAVNEAQRRFPDNTFDGCFYCSNACHTR